LHSDDILRLYHIHKLTNRKVIDKNMKVSNISLEALLLAPYKVVHVLMSIKDIVSLIFSWDHELLNLVFLADLSIPFEGPNEPTPFLF